VASIGLSHDSSVPTSDVKRHRGWLGLAVVLATLGVVQLISVIAWLIVGDSVAALAALAGIVICYWFGVDAWRRAEGRRVPSQSPGI
jgi:hypothetical protein